MDLPRPDPRADRSMRFGQRLALVAAGGVVARVVYVLVVVRDQPLGVDAIWYKLQGTFIRGGRGYIDPGVFFDGGGQVSTARFPPLYPAFVAAVAQVESADTLTLRLAGCIPAVATIVLTAMLARRVLGDDRVALLAAGIIAVSPLAIATDASIMSEQLSVPATLVALLLVHRLMGSGTVTDMVLVGVAVGVGSLARMDVALAAVAAIVLGLRSVQAGWRTVLGSLVVVSLTAALVVSPWVLRNHRAVGAATITTTSLSTAIAGANCEDTYFGDRVGGWTYACTDGAQLTPGNEADYSDTILRRSVRYAADHASRTPVVAGARVLRVWGMWDPRVLSEREAIASRQYDWQMLGWVFGMAMIALAAMGLVGLRRRRVAVPLLVAPLLAVTGIAVLTYGTQRFRAPAEPALAILAAWTLCQLQGRRRRVPEVVSRGEGSRLRGG